MVHSKIVVPQTNVHIQDQRARRDRTTTPTTEATPGGIKFRKRDSIFKDRPRLKTKKKHSDYEKYESETDSDDDRYQPKSHWEV